MPKMRHAQVILLLADGFDEAAVGIILATLRRAGLAVSLLSLRARRVSSAHGLVVIPDTSLDRFIVTPAPILALVLPEGAGHLARLRTDPRVSVLLQRCIVDQAVLVGLGDQATEVITDLAEINGETIKIIAPEAGMYLEEFAGNLAKQLIGISEKLA